MNYNKNRLKEHIIQSFHAFYRVDTTSEKEKRRVLGVEEEYIVDGDYIGGYILIVAETLGVTLDDNVLRELITKIARRYNIKL